ncbi:hypothetical protein Mapa_013255 [Marchantia paleacea]|nr:hypothetical protein Mapa_013255 [Marchantia paleacea]
MAKGGGAHGVLETQTERAPVTIQRPVPTDLKFEKPYLPRALEAVDSEHHHGTLNHDNQNYTVMQQHVAYFDRNNDGIIYPWETYTGFRLIGFNPFISLLAMFVINGAFSYPTLPGWIPSLMFPIYIKNIHKAKHGSDSDVYDTEGRFVPSKFEEIWSKYAKTYPDRMNFRELLQMSEAMRNAVDPFGWFANKFEWGFTYWLAKDEEGWLSKEVTRGIYDGSFFEYVEKSLKQRAMLTKKMK